MKHLLCLLVCGALATLAPAQDFTTTLTPAERAAAGLDRLNADELAALKAVVERYKAGEVAEVRQQAATAVAAAREAVEARPAPPPPPSAKPASGPSWVAGLVSAVKRAPGTTEDETLHSRLVGDFRGWTKGTILTLENGQRWQVSGTDAYNTPPIAAPAVRIKPGAFNSFWMSIDGGGPSVRVRPYQID